MKTMIGEVFGRLTVKRFFCFRKGYNRGREKMFECECSCQPGKMHVTSERLLRAKKGGCKSCGCLRREMALEKLKRGKATQIRRAQERRMVAVE
jgi:hypothetical protein